MAKFVIYKPEVENQPNMDSYGVFENERGSFLAFVSDAPHEGNIDTGTRILHFLKNASHTILNRVLNMSPEGISLLVADIMTSLNEDLHSINIKIQRNHQNDKKFQSTCSIVLSHNGILYSLAYGDSPIYFVGYDNILRLSDSTRARNLLFNENNVPSEDIIEYHDDFPHYIGVRNFCFSQNDVIQIPTKGQKFIIMASDGGEKALKLQIKSADFYRTKNINQLEESLRHEMQILEMHSDDITLSVIEVVDKEGFADIVTRRLKTAETSIKDIINDYNNNNEILKASIGKIDTNLAEFRNAYKMEFQKVYYRIDYLMKKEKEYNIMQEEINYRMSNLDSTIEQAVKKQIGKILQFSEHNKHDKEPAGEMLALHGPDIPSGPNKEDSHSKKQTKAAKRKSEKKTPKNVQRSNKYMYIIYWLIILLLTCLVIAALFRKPIGELLFPKASLKDVEKEVFIMYVPEGNTDDSISEDNIAYYDPGAENFDMNKCYKINIADYKYFKKNTETKYNYPMTESETIAAIKARFGIIGKIERQPDGSVKVSKLQYRYKIIDEKLENYKIIQELFGLEDPDIDFIKDLNNNNKSKGDYIKIPFNDERIEYLLDTMKEDRNKQINSSNRDSGDMTNDI